MNRINVVALNGSARKGGNTSILLKTVLNRLEQEGIQTELIEMSGAKIHSCILCRECLKRRNCRCGPKDDEANTYIAKMEKADGILLGSPLSGGSISPQMKALTDRARLVGRANGGMFRRKVGAGVIAVRGAGAIQAFHALNHFFLISEMVIPGSTSWNVAAGGDIGTVEKDKEGIQNMKVLGRNMAWLLKKIKV